MSIIEQLFTAKGAKGAKKIKILEGGGRGEH
jgi:hypothetical protein